MKKIFEKINFKQPKYMLPAILYIPLLAASYFIFDLFNTGKAEIPDKSLQTTEFLNPNLPDATIKGGDGIGSKYENMEKSWGKIQDYSAVDNIERDEPDDDKEKYESQYSQEEVALLGELEQQKALAEETADAKTREQEALKELERALAEARLKAQEQVAPIMDDSLEEQADTSVTVSGTIEEDSRAVHSDGEYRGRYEHRPEREAEAAAEGEDADAARLVVRVGGVVYELDRLRVEERDAGAAYDDRYAEAEEARREAGQRYAAARHQHSGGDGPRRAALVRKVAEVADERLHGGADEVRYHDERGRRRVAVAVRRDEEGQHCRERPLVYVRAEMPERHQIFIFSVLLQSAHLPAVNAFAV